MKIQFHMRIFVATTLRVVGEPAIDRQEKFLGI
jgi:hypothetical protein